jgi:diguanylate cyclase (GGDEF)-like protein/PAS domain S-box-containing protein
VDPMGPARAARRRGPIADEAAPVEAGRVPEVSLALLDSAPDAVLGVDADGAVRLANPAAAALLGRSRDELQATPAADLVPGVLDEGSSDLCAYHADGHEIPVEVSRMPLPSEHGRLTVCILRDTTESRRIEAELRVSRRRLAEAEQLARIGSWEWDIPAGRVEWSDQLFRIYGLEPGACEPSYEGFLGFVHPDDRDDVDARNRKAFADHQPFEDIKRVVRADGTEILMRTQGEVITDATGAPVRMIGVCEDVTSEERAARTRSTLASIVQSSGDAIYAVDGRGRIASWNPAAERLFGHPEAEMLGRTPECLIPAEIAEHERTVLQRVLAGDPVSRFETQRLHRDGSLVEVALTISPIVGGEPVGGAGSGIAGASVIARDISERRRLESQLRHLADHDGLTGLINRSGFEAKLAERIADTEGHGVGGAVLAIDLDNVKDVNDIHGHETGDAVIRAAAHCLREQLRPTDVVARLDGDEFAVILPHTDAHEARRIATQLVDAIRARTVEAGERTIHTTASIGVATFDAERPGGESVLPAACQALYTAKESGRNCVVLEEPDASARPQPGLGQQLRDALADDGLCLHLQPILDLASGEIARYEVLVRMRTPDGLVPPAAFIGVAERLGLIHALDSWVLRSSIGLLAEHPGLVLEVNVSGRSVGDHALLALIAQELAAGDVDPSRLILEITETAAIANMDDARNFADALRAMGCSFALDDFGAGFGSFYYLKHMQADILKIDGDFIAGPRSQIDELVIQSIVRIARELGKHTVAEYVDDEETVRTLRGWGVDFAQGFHIGRPFPSEELVAPGVRAPSG